MEPLRLHKPTPQVGESSCFQLPGGTEVLRGTEAQNKPEVGMKSLWCGESPGRRLQVPQDSQERIRMSQPLAGISEGSEDG